MGKKELIYNLEKQIYCRLAPSKIHGIGVVAIKDIPKGVNPFELTGGKCGSDKIIKVHKDDIEKINPNVKKMMDDFLGADENGYYDVPKNGLNDMNVSFYMNHSDKANIEIVNGGKCNFVTFRAKKVIKEGEELTINYNKY